MAPDVHTGPAFGLVLGDENNVNQYYLGAGRPPTVFRQRVANFLAEYLGREGHPVPFGGRDRHLADLDAWLENPDAAPFLLLSGGAGKGKTALLVRWVTRLARDDLQVVFLPVSIRYRTNLASVFFTALAAGLAEVHGDDVPVPADATAEVCRGVVSDYLARPLPDGRRLLVVLDGVDEAAGWKPGPDLVPRPAPAGLRVVVSARDQSGAQWLADLGWADTGLGTAWTVGPLARDDVEDVVRRCSSRAYEEIPELTDRLYRGTEGDPLLLSLYLRDLTTRGLTDLADLPAGLDGYFNRWWQEQKDLWQAEYGPSEARAIETQVDAVMALLSRALGPLRAEDLAELDGGFRSTPVGTALEPIARFLIGDGHDHGYAFSHDRLAEFWAARRVLPSRRRELDTAFTDWGLGKLALLREGRLVPRDMPPYVVQFLGAHLERSAVEGSGYLPLLHDTWRQAWQALEGTDAGYLADVAACRAVLRTADAESVAAGRPARYLHEQIRCVLAECGVRDQAAGISAQLLVALVEAGEWTPAQALTYARHVTEPRRAAHSLLAAAQVAAPESQAKVAAEALAAADSEPDAMRRVPLLAGIVPRAAALGALPEAWAATETLRDTDYYGQVLGEMAEFPHDTSPTWAMDFVMARIRERERSSSWSADWRPGMVLGLARNLPQAQRTALCQEAVDSIVSFPGGPAREFLWSVAEMLPPSFALELLGEVRDRQRALRSIGVLLPRLPAPLRDELAGEALALALAEQADATARNTAMPLARRLIDLAQALPPGSHGPLLEHVRRLDEWTRGQTLALMTPHLSPEHRQLALGLAEGITLRLPKAAVWAAVGVSLGPAGRRDEGDELLDRALTTAVEVGDPHTWAGLVQRHAAVLPTSWLLRLADGVEELSARRARVGAATVLAAELGRRGHSDRALGLADARGHADDRLEVLLRVAESLPNESLAAWQRHVVRAAADTEGRQLLHGVRRGGGGSSDRRSALVSALLPHTARLTDPHDRIVTTTSLLAQAADAGRHVERAGAAAVLEFLDRTDAGPDEFETEAVLRGLIVCGHPRLVDASPVLRRLPDTARSRLAQAAVGGLDEAAATRQLAELRAHKRPDAGVLITLASRLPATSLKTAARLLPKLPTDERERFRVALAKRWHETGHDDRAFALLRRNNWPFPDSDEIGALAEAVSHMAPGRLHADIPFLWRRLKAATDYYSDDRRLVSALPESVCDAVFQYAMNDADREERDGGTAWPLAAALLVTRLPRQRRPDAARRLWSRLRALAGEALWVRPRALPHLLPYLDDPQRGKATATLTADATEEYPPLERPSGCAPSMLSLTPFLTSSQVRVALRELTWPQSLGPVTSSVLPLAVRLASEGDTEARKLLDGLPGTSPRQDALIELARNSAGDRRSALLREALTLARRVSDGPTAARLLGRLAAWAAQEHDRPSWGDRLLTALRRVTGGMSINTLPLRELAALLEPGRSRDLLAGVAGAAMSRPPLHDRDARHELCAAVVAMAATGLGGLALSTVAGIDDPLIRHAALTAALPVLDDALLDRALALARDTATRNRDGVDRGDAPAAGGAWQVRMLLAIAARLAPARRSAVVDEALAAAADARAEDLATAFDELPEPTPGQLATIKRIAAQAEPFTRCDLLVRAARWLPSAELPGVLASIRALPGYEYERLLPLLLPALCAAGQGDLAVNLLDSDIPDHERCHVVAMLFELADPPPRELAPRLLSLVLAAPEGLRRTHALLALAPFLPPPLLESAASDPELVSQGSHVHLLAEAARATCAHSPAQTETLLRKAFAEYRSHGEQDGGWVLRVVDILSPPDMVEAFTMTPRQDVLSARIAGLPLAERYQVVSGLLDLLSGWPRTETLGTLTALLPALGDLVDGQFPAALFEIVDASLTNPG
ncbi:hypothetical protein GCM10010260_39220 [Streptomyces filipinensis]|uniref:NACHT domain-containing protein n=1 Tax=Streptomyces filipinensis TaxID=66887 RepID=A0A918MCF3_9ACTN|nr:hypothetical protein [Streptomyces filipinensis]GGU99157.1 hypothetical protein GCM10010260_39220 [Streptomyces filipinensis]